MKVTMFFLLTALEQGEGREKEECAGTKEPPAIELLSLITKQREQHQQKSGKSECCRDQTVERQKPARCNCADNRQQKPEKGSFSNQFIHSLCTKERIVISPACGVTQSRSCLGRERNPVRAPSTGVWSLPDSPKRIQSYRRPAHRHRRPPVFSRSPG